LNALASKKTLQLFEELNILNHREVEARHEIQLELYMKKIQIESRIIGDLVLNHIIPAAITYQKQLVENLNGLKNLFSAADFKTASSVQLELVKELSERINFIKVDVDKMTEARKKANTITDAKKMAIDYCDKVKPHFETIRYHVDKLELIVNDAVWPLPKYRELMNLK
jgi:glutamine synthetase